MKVIIVILNMNTNLKKIECQLSNFIIFDLKTKNTSNAKPYGVSFYIDYVN